MDILHQFSADMRAGPTWILYWVGFMALVFALSIPFALTRKEARWIAVSTLLLAPALMLALYAHFGYQRILGLGHIIGWAPGLYYAFKHKQDWQVKQTLAGKYLVLVIATMLVSLAFDFTDVVRFMLGSGAIH